MPLQQGCRSQGGKPFLSSWQCPGHWLQIDSGRMYCEAKNWSCSALWWRDGAPCLCPWVWSLDLEMNRIFPTSHVSSILSPRGRARSTAKGCMGAHSGSFFLPSVEKKMHFWGVTHLSYFTHLLWDDTKGAPKLYIPFCGPYWELGWVVTCQRNPFVLRTGYS